MIEIREAREGDIDSIANFQIEMALETEGINLEKEVVQKGVANCLRDPSKGIYFIAEINGEATGSLLITYEWSDWRNCNIWWIQSVFVSAENRGKGVFKAMYNHVRQKVALSDNIGGLRLYVDNTNTRAMEVYKKLGMDGDHYKVFEWMK